MRFLARRRASSDGKDERNHRPRRVGLTAATATVNLPQTTLGRKLRAPLGMAAAAETGHVL